MSRNLPRLSDQWGPAALASSDQWRAVMRCVDSEGRGQDMTLANFLETGIHDDIKSYIITYIYIRLERWGQYIT